jgi:DNA-binding transcriptional regulator LsrR (DeoR family)
MTTCSVIAPYQGEGAIVPERNIDDRSMLIAAAAKLRSKGQRQDEIAKTLGVSQPEISRLLIEARNGKWLERAPRFQCPDAAVWAAAEQRFFSTVETRDGLRQAFPEGGRRLHGVTVLHLTSEGEIAQGAAEVIRGLLGDAGSVGITWGRTISNLVDALRDRAIEMPKRDQAHRVQFVPLCGEPLMDVRDPSRHSSSVLAEQLAAIFNSGEPGVSAPSIAGVPAFIPLKFGKPSEVATIRRFLSGVRGYARVFSAADQTDSATPPLVDKLDAILTSVGVVSREYRGIFLRERLAAEDISERDLERCVVGDLGGVLIPAREISKDDETRIARMNDRWTGVRLAQVQSCAEAALRAGFDGKKPGVLLLAMGKWRLGVAQRCVELGLVNELVVDPELEQALRSTIKTTDVR